MKTSIEFNNIFKEVGAMSVWEGALVCVWKAQYEYVSAYSQTDI